MGRETHFTQSVFNLLGSSPVNPSSAVRIDYVCQEEISWCEEDDKAEDEEEEAAEEEDEEVVWTYL